MRVVIVGAGAVGGVVGGRLAEAGTDVALVARGAHGAAMRDGGLTVVDPEREFTVRVPVFERIAAVGLGADDVVCLAVKSQDTVAVLDELVAAGVEVPVACFQNGVENERAALRRLPVVLGVCVMLPAAHLTPGRVEAYAWPIPGLFDVGRYPEGSDPSADALVEALNSAGFDARAVAEVMRWKYTKLLMNLGNSVEAMCPRDRDAATLAARARDEGRACLDVAGIAYASADEERERRGDRLRVGVIDGRSRGGGSSWQSLARGTGAIESDYLNGEVVLLGRLHRVPTPVNELLAREARAAAIARTPPGTISALELLNRLR